MTAPADNQHADWLDEAELTRQRSPRNDTGNAGRGDGPGVDVEPPPRTPQPEKPAMEQPQPEKIPPGGGTKRGM